MKQPEHYLYWDVFAHQKRPAMKSVLNFTHTPRGNLSVSQKSLELEKLGENNMFNSSLMVPISIKTSGIVLTLI